MRSFTGFTLNNVIKAGNLTYHGKFIQVENQNYLLFDLLILTFNLIYAKTLCLSLIENGTDFGSCSHRYISIAPMPHVQKVSLFQKAEKFKTNKSNQKIREIIIINFLKKIKILLSKRKKEF